MSLSDLPVELLQRIIKEHCNNQSIHALRLTCRNTCLAANEFLIRQHPIYYHEAHIEQLAEIAKGSADIRKGIKRFTFFIDRLKRYDDFEAWNRARRRSFQNAAGSPMFWHIRKSQNASTGPGMFKSFERWHEENRSIESRPEEMASLAVKCYRTYSRFVQYQAMLEHGPNLRRRLSAFFAACPNLEHLSFSIKSYEEGRLLDITFQSGMVIPEGDVNGGTFHLQETLLAAHDAGLKVKQLSLTHLERCITETPNWLWMKEIHEVLQQVEELYWTFQQCELMNTDPLMDVDDFHEALAAGRMRKVLTHCPKLCKLDFCGPDADGGQEDAIFPQLSHVVGEQYWKTLRDVTLCNVRSTAQELASFLLRHSQTLQSIDLSVFHLTEGDWGECFGMVAGKLPLLKNVTLYRSLSSIEHDGADYWFDDDPSPEFPVDKPEPFAEWLMKGGEGPPWGPGARHEGEEVSEDVDEEEGFFASACVMDNTYAMEEAEDSDI